MAYQTLYRKYRPISFDLVYGQFTIVKTLKNIIKSQKISHAYLFTGPRGTGKTSSAKLFAKALNCLDNKDGDACNKCENCKSYNENQNPDIIEIDAASNNGVDEVREIISKVKLVPSFSKYKVYIIDEVHMLSIGAFNALLKTLEEPPKHVIFILATTEPQKIPETIISRCQRFDFKNISHIEMKKCLNNIIKLENIIIDDEALDEIIFNSKGGMRDAIGMLDQAFTFSSERITKNDIETLSGTVSENKLIEFINNVIENNINEVLSFNEYIYENGKDYELVLNKVLDLLRVNLIEQKLKKTPKIKINDTKTIYYIDNFEHIYEKICKFQNKKIVFDVEILRMLSGSNVSRETLPEKEINLVKNNKEVDNNIKKENNELINQLKSENETLHEIRINNILLTAKKEKLNEVQQLWPKIKDFLFDSKYKLCAGIMSTSIPAAASEEGLIINVGENFNLQRINDNYNICLEMINKLIKVDKAIFVSDNFWKENRPKYIEKIKNKELKYINENDIIKKNSVNEFTEFIEMEEE